MGLVVVVINNLVFVICNWFLRYNNKIYSNKIVFFDDLVGWRGSFWKVFFKFCFLFNKFFYCVRVEG